MPVHLLLLCNQLADLDADLMADLVCISEQAHIRLGACSEILLFLATITAHLGRFLPRLGPFACRTASFL